MSEADKIIDAAAEKCMAYYDDSDEDGGMRMRFTVIIREACARLDDLKEPPSPPYDRCPFAECDSTPRLSADGKCWECGSGHAHFVWGADPLRINLAEAPEFQET